MTNITARFLPSYGCAAACLMGALLATASAVPALAQTANSSLIMLTPDLDSDESVTTNAIHTDVASSQKKVESGNFFTIQADNGWVLFQGLTTDPTLSFYDAFGSKSGSFKLVTPGAGSNQSIFYDGGGLVFAPCAPGPKNRCSASENGITGVGLGFGQVNDGSSAGGWVSDDDLTEHRTNSDLAPGSIAALAVSTASGAYAVGWDRAATGSARATMISLNAAAGETYTPVAQYDLGTLGGATSQALGISKQATYVVGVATTFQSKEHAVYAPVAGITSACGATDSCWIDLEANIVAAVTTAGYSTVIKSVGLVANDAGYIVGTVLVKETFGTTTKPVNLGFEFNINTGTTTVFSGSSATPENVIPLKVLSDGSVVGNLQLLPLLGTTGQLPLYHPFVAQGTTLAVTDLGTLNGNVSCRVSNPNDNGELVGACIPNATTAYGAGLAFYINAKATTPTFTDLNAAIHSLNDAASPQYRNYIYGVASSIDDEEEITVMGLLTNPKASTITRAGFLVQQNAY